MFITEREEMVKRNCLTFDHEAVPKEKCSCYRCDWLAVRKSVCISNFVLNPQVLKRKIQFLSNLKIILIGA